MTTYSSRAYRKSRRDAFVDWLDNVSLALSMWALFLVTVLFLVAPIVY